MKVSLNGTIVERKEAAAKVETDGLYYGLGCFETLMSYESRFLHLGKHFQRLNEGVSYLTGSSRKLFSEDLLRTEIIDLLEVNNLGRSQARVRIQYSIAERFGYSIPVSENPEYTCLITVDKVQDIKKDSYKLKTVDTTVVPLSSRPTHLKLSNMLHYRQAAIEAKRAGADDGLMLTVTGDVAETSIANIFWEKDGVFYTPSYDCDILPGTARSIVIDIIEKSGGEVRQGQYRPEVLKSATHVWVCNSIKEVLPVTKIDRTSFTVDSKVSRKLQKDFESYKKEHLV